MITDKLYENINTIISAHTNTHHPHDYLLAKDVGRQKSLSNVIKLLIFYIKKKEIAHYYGIPAAQVEIYMSHYK